MPTSNKLPTPEERPDLYDDYDCRPEPVGPRSPEAREYLARLFEPLSKQERDKMAETSLPDVEA